MSKKIRWVEMELDDDDTLCGLVNAVNQLLSDLDEANDCIKYLEGEVATLDYKKMNRGYE